METAGITNKVNRQINFLKKGNLMILGTSFINYGFVDPKDELSPSAIISSDISSSNSFTRLIDCSVTPISNFFPSILTIIKYCFGLMCCFPKTSNEKKSPSGDNLFLYHLRPTIIKMMMIPVIPKVLKKY